jgi:hypothetical protein
MTEEQIKAAISQHFVQIIASRGGFKCAKPETDHGCDLTITKVATRQQAGRVRYIDSGYFVDIQLKCTCEAQVIRTDADIAYDLEVKNYNDLIHRRDSGALTPLILVLLVLPDEPAEWLTVTADNMIVRRAAYWFVPPPDATATDNAATIRIHIPTANTVDLTFIEQRFQEAFA